LFTKLNFLLYRKKDGIATSLPQNHRQKEKENEQRRKKQKRTGITRQITGCNIKLNQKIYHEIAEI
jgi:hypothetical protein